MSLLDFEKKGTFFCIECNTSLFTHDSLLLHLKLISRQHNIQQHLQLKNSLQEILLNFASTELKDHENLVIMKVSQITEKIRIISQKAFKKITETKNTIEKIQDQKILKNNEDINQIKPIFLSELEINPELVTFLKLKNFKSSKVPKKLNRKKVSNIVHSLNIIQLFKKRVHCRCNQKKFKTVSQVKSHRNCTFFTQLSLKDYQYENFLKIISQKLNILEKIKVKLIKKLQKLQSLDGSVSEFFVKICKLKYLLHLECFSSAEAEDLLKNYTDLLNIINDQTILLTLENTLKQLNLLEKILNHDFVVFKESEDSKKLFFFSQFIGKIKCFCLNHRKNKLYIGSADSTIRCFKIYSQIQEYILFGHTSKVTSLVLFDNGKKLISGSYDKTIRIWNLKTRIHCILSWLSINPISSISIAANNEILAINEVTGVLTIYNILRKEKIFEKEKTNKCEFIDNHMISIQFNSETWFFNLSTNRQEIFNAYNFTVSNKNDFLLLFSWYDGNKTLIFKYEISTAGRYLITTLESITKQAILLTNDEDLIVLSDSFIYLVSITAKTIIRKINFPALDDSVKPLNLNTAKTIIILTRKSKVFKVELSKSTKISKKLVNLQVFYQSKTVKSLNFLYSLSSNRLLRVDLSKKKLTTIKLLKKPSCLKLSTERQLLVISMKGLIQGYDPETFRVTLNHETKDKISALCISKSNNLVAASYLDSKNHLSYISLITPDGRVKQCIKTNISEPIICLEFFNSCNNLVLGSKKGLISIWSSESRNQLKVFDITCPNLLKLSFSLSCKFLYLGFRNHLITKLDTKSAESSQVTISDLDQLQVDLDQKDFESFTFLV